MVFSYNNETKIIYATIQNGDITERYEGSLTSCPNPVCTCGVVQLQLFPLGQEDRKDQLIFHSVPIDIIHKKLDYDDEDLDQNQIAEENLKFANSLISNMEDTDFQYLWEVDFAFKNKLSGEAAADSIQAKFDFDEVEKNALMSAYNDVLPYGDQLLVSINGQNCIVYDQYCLLPGCPCSDAHLTVFLAGEYNNPGKELYFITVDYRKKNWGVMEGLTDSVDANTVRSAIEERIPDVYERFLNRHMKLRSIYASCKKKHYAHAPHHSPEAGRNDPCPCGSGKKYKKCCLRN